jgi:predicted phage terminase large subunit-like protein
MSFKDKASSDFVAGHVWKRKGANCYLVARIRDRLNFPATIHAVRRMTGEHPGVSLKLVEDKANGPAVISTLESEITGLVGVEPDGDKVARANAVTAMWEAGNVRLPHPAIAPWVKGFVLEHLQFPLGVHDDDVDAGTQALRRFQQQMELEAARDEFEKRRQGSVSMRTTRM